MEAFDASIRMPRAHAATVSLVKDEAALKAMRKKLEDGLSPSALGDWLRCPLDFHFKHVLKLKESEEIDVRIAPNVLGEALHATVEAIYRPLLGKPLQEASLLEAIGTIEAMLMGRLGEEMAEDQLAHGQPLLQVRMAVHAAQRFLRNEAEAVRNGAVITPVDLEVPLKQRLETASAAIGSPVFLKGRLDRVDRLDGLVRILDLKTGKVDPADLSVKELSLEGFIGKKRYAAQLLVYAWLYLMDHPELEALQTGILPLQRAASSEPLTMKMPEGTTVTKAMLPVIEELFTQFILRMMDPAVPIVHDPQSKYCTFCLGNDHVHATPGSMAEPDPFPSIAH